MNDKNMEDKLNVTEDTDNVTPSESTTDTMEEGTDAAAMEQVEEAAGGGPTIQLSEYEAATEKLRAELEEVKDKHLRLIAEFDNFRRRTAKENNEMRLTANKEVIQSLLVVLDDMARAETQLSKTEDLTVIKEGITLVFNKLRGILQNKGLKIMEHQNEEFDADLHEAITEVPAPEDKAGKIIDVVEPGYYLNDRLIRFAKVVVGK